MRQGAWRGPLLVLCIALLPALAQAASGAARPGVSFILAWAGAGAICASLLLMVRAPGIAAWFGGLERMYRWHHALGTAGYAAALTHPLALALPAAIEAPHLAWRTIAPAAGDAGGLLGWGAALGLAIGLGATFALRLPYGLWRRLHATLGASVLLGILHAALERGWWPGAAVLALIALAGIAWRVLGADLGGGSRPYVVEAVAHPAQSMTELTLRPLDAPIRALPGQFMLLAFFDGPHYRGCGEYHPFSVSGILPDGRLSFTVKDLGDCTHRMQHVAPGVAVHVQGPFGEFMRAPSGSPELWIAGGIGIAAFLARLRAGGLSQPTRLVYLYRRDPDGAYLDELRRRAASDRRLTLTTLASGNDTGALVRALGDAPIAAGAVAYLCGPQEMIRQARSILEAAGVTADRIHSEVFDFR